MLKVFHKRENKLSCWSELPELYIQVEKGARVGIEDSLKKSTQTSKELVSSEPEV